MDHSARRPAVTSIVIAAHNEAAVIGRCLDELLRDAAPGEFDVIVVANGCTDATVQVAAERSGVRVIELASPGKVGALNAGDEAAARYPRIYLDADIIIASAGIRALCAALTPAGADSSTRILATTARRNVDLTHSPLLVRSYFAINSRLPVFRNSLFGRGVIVLSAEGRARFGRFPDLTADDLFVDSLFAAAEKRELESVSSTIAAPRKTRDLIRRLTRVRRANAAMRALQPTRTDARSAAPRAASMSWLFDVVLRNPALIPAATCYVGITVTAVILARRQRRSTVTWARDESSRHSNDQSSDAETANAHR